MAPTRRTRNTGATPAPEDVISPPSHSPAMKTRVTGLVGNVAKHSESYGSPPTARPVRSNLAGDGTVNQAIGKVFSQVRKDHQRIEEDRRAAAVQAAAKDAQTKSHPKKVEMEVDEDEETEPEYNSNSDEDVEMEDDAAPKRRSRGKAPVVEKPVATDRPQRRSASPRKQGPNRDVANGESSHAQPSRKRKQASTEPDAQLEQDRSVRNARLQSERQKEASRITTQKRLDVTQTVTSSVAGGSASQSLGQLHQSPAADSVASDSAQTGFARPPARIPAFGVQATPLARDRSPDKRLGSFSGRSFIEESNIFANAELHTPAASVTGSEQRGSSLPPPVMPPILEFSSPDPKQPARDRVDFRAVDQNADEEEEANEEVEDEDELAKDMPPPSFPKRRGRPPKTASNPFRADANRGATPVLPASSTNLPRRPSPRRQEKRILDENLGPGEDEEETVIQQHSSPDPLDGEREVPESRQAFFRNEPGGAGDHNHVRPDPEPRERPRRNMEPEEPELRGFLHRLQLLRDEFIGEPREVWARVRKSNLGTVLLASLLSLVALWASLVLPRILSTDHAVHWYGWRDWDHNIGQFFLPVGSLSDDMYGSLSEDLFRQSATLNQLGSKLEQNELVVDKLNAILPRVIHVKRSANGQVVVADDFWHALKDLMSKDKTLVHMNDMLKEVEKLGGPEAKKRATEEMQKISKKTVSDAWASWEANNKKQIDRALGETMANAEKKMAAHNEKLIEKKLAGARLPDNVLTREEFIDELQKEIKTRSSNSDAEIAEIRRRLSDLAKTTEKLESAVGKVGQAAIEKAVREAIANARLKVAANDNIAAHLGELSRKMNHFSVGNGASVDHYYTSPTFQPKGSKMSNRLSSSTQDLALRSWEEPGECWCAGSRGPYGNPIPVDIAVHLKTRIVPEHLVIEHVDPAVTLDAQSTPKDLEAWIRLEDRSTRALAANLMWARYPDTPKDHPLLAKDFVKVAALQYIWDDGTGGVVVHRLTDELRAVDAHTAHVIVRAATNYGADHTCFYRIRLYGEPRDLAVRGGAGRYK